MMKQIKTETENTTVYIKISGIANIYPRKSGTTCQIIEFVTF